MLPFRLILVLVAAVLCLWSLFALLDNLKEPGLLHSGNTTVVKGCDSLDNDAARRLCPPLMCQHKLIVSKALAPRRSVRTATDRIHDDQRLIVLAANTGTPTAEYFVCVMQRDQHVMSLRVEPEEIEMLAQHDGGWIELLSARIEP